MWGSLSWLNGLVDCKVATGWTWFIGCISAKLVVWTAQDCHFIQKNWNDTGFPIRQQIFFNSLMYCPLLCRWSVYTNYKPEMSKMPPIIALIECHDLRPWSKPPIIFAGPPTAKVKTTSRRLVFCPPKMFRHERNPNMRGVADFSTFHHVPSTFCPCYYYIFWFSKVTYKLWSGVETVNPLSQYCSIAIDGAEISEWRTLTTMSWDPRARGFVFSLLHKNLGRLHTSGVNFCYHLGCPTGVRCIKNYVS